MKAIGQGRARADVESGTGLPGTIRDLEAALRRFLSQEKYSEGVRIAEELARRRPCRATYYELGRLCRHAGEHRRAIRALRNALRFVDGPRHLVPSIHVQAAYAWYFVGNRNLMSRALKRAYAVVRRPRDAHGLHMMLGSDHFMKNRYDRALEEFLNAVRAASTPDERARAVSNAGLALIRQGTTRKGFEYLGRAIRIQQRRRQWTELAATRVFCAALYVDLGQWRRALGMLRRAAAVFRRFGKGAQEAEALQNLAYVAAELGYWTLAIASATRAIELAKPQKWWEIRSRSHAIRAWAYAKEELFPAAEEELAIAEGLLEDHRDDWCLLHIARAKVRIAEIYGDWQAMCRAARYGEKVAARIPDEVRLVEFRRHRALAEEHFGRERAAYIARRNADDLDRAWGVRQEADGRIVDGPDLDRAARNDAPILIVGEIATGKTELARAIHRMSPRRHRRRIEVPCEQLVFPEAELYGHVKGAWSGATRSGKGYARSAAGGTLILDRIDEMRPDQQRLLVPILEKSVKPVGSVIEERIDVRLIGIARDIGKIAPAVRDRLNVIVLRVRPLRERKDEIPRRVQALLRGGKKITCDAMAALVSYAWDGNFAELQAVVERLQVLADHTIGRTLVRSVLKRSELDRVRGKDQTRQRKARRRVATVRSRPAAAVRPAASAERLRKIATAP